MVADLLPLIGGGTFGAIIKLISLKMQDSAEKQKRFIEALDKRNDIAKDRNEIASKNRRFSATRQIITLGVLSVVVGTFWLQGTTSIPINIPVESTEGASYLFGLIDTRVTTTEYQPFVGRIVLQDILPAFQAIMGTYIGASLSDRR